MLSFFVESFNQSANTFQEAKLNAKLSGKLLAHYLAQNNPTFGDQSISMIGFSLGCQVTKSMINRLAKLGRTDLIHNVTFIAGATYIKDHKLDV